MKNTWKISGRLVDIFRGVGSLDGPFSKFFSVKAKCPCSKNVGFRIGFSNLNLSSPTLKKVNFQLWFWFWVWTLALMYFKLFYFILFIWIVVLQCCTLYYHAVEMLHFTLLMLWQVFTRGSTYKNIFCSNFFFLFKMPLLRFKL